MSDPPGIAMLNAGAYARRSAQPAQPDEPKRLPQKPLPVLTVPTVQPPTMQSRVSSSWSKAALSLLAERRRRTYLL